MNGDLKAAIQMLAADNARLCDIALAADKLAEALDMDRRALSTLMRRALEAYKIARQGQ